MLRPSVPDSQWLSQQHLTLTVHTVGPKKESHLKTHSAIESNTASHSAAHPAANTQAAATADGYARQAAAALAAGSGFGGSGSGASSSPFSSFGHSSDAASSLLTVENMIAQAQVVLPLTIIPPFPVNPLGVSAEHLVKRGSAAEHLVHFP